MGQKLKFGFNNNIIIIFNDAKIINNILLMIKNKK